MNEESIVVSVRIGNSHDWEIISPGETYNFKVNRNTFIKGLKQKLCEKIHDHETKKIIRF